MPRLWHHPLDPLVKPLPSWFASRLAHPLKLALQRALLTHQLPNRKVRLQTCRLVSQQFCLPVALLELRLERPLVPRVKRLVEFLIRLQLVHFLTPLRVHQLKTPPLVSLVMLLLLSLIVLRPVLGLGLLLVLLLVILPAHFRVPLVPPRGFVQAFLRVVLRLLQVLLRVLLLILLLVLLLSSSLALLLVLLVLLVPLLVLLLLLPAVL